MAKQYQWKPKIDFFSTSSTSKTKGKNKKKSEQSGLWMPREKLIDGLYVPPNDPTKLNKIHRKRFKDTAGPGWFDMPASTITQDLQLLKLRNVLDPKRHYKRSDSKSKALAQHFQVGTVIESPMEYYSSRLTKKERKASFVDELLSDQNLTNYRKRKVREIEEQNRPAGNPKWKIKRHQSRGRGKKWRH